MRISAFGRPPIAILVVLVATFTFLQRDLELDAFGRDVESVRTPRSNVSVIVVIVFLSSAGSTFFKVSSVLNVFRRVSFVAGT